MNSPRSVCVLTDAPGTPVCRSLALLYPGRTATLDFSKEPHGAEVLSQYSHVFVHAVRPQNAARLDFAAVRAFVAAGGTAACALAEFAQHHGAQLVKSFVLDGSEEPGIRIRVANDITRGFAVGDVTPWFGKVSHAPLNENNPNQYFQRQILGLREADGIRILGVSTLNGGAVLIEECIGQGRLMALDFRSLIFEPYFNAFGCTNKYLFLGNLFGGSVRYGKHYARKLPYAELRREMQAMAARLPGLTYAEEGTASDGQPLASLSLGRPGQPAFLFTNGIHGWEWEAGYGLLHLAELLAGPQPPEGLDSHRFHLKVVPQLNPFGYDHDTRQNANGVDLNRNFPCAWEGFVSSQDISVPWDFDYKGPAPASEVETRIVQRLIAEMQPRCLLDFHTAHYIFCKAAPGDQALMDAIHADIKERWRDRYVIGRPYATTYEQVGMEASTTYAPAPHLVCYAAAQGVTAPILIEMSGNRTKTQGLVMVTDTTIEICLAALHQCLR